MTLTGGLRTVRTRGIGPTRNASGVLVRTAGAPGSVTRIIRVYVPFLIPAGSWKVKLLAAFAATVAITLLRPITEAPLRTT